MVQFRDPCGSNTTGTPRQHAISAHPLISRPLDIQNNWNPFITSMKNNNTQATASKTSLERVNSSDLPGAVPTRSMDSPTIEHSRSSLDEIDRGNDQQKDEKTAENDTKKVCYYCKSSPLFSFMLCLTEGLLRWRFSLIFSC